VAHWLFKTEPGEFSIDQLAAAADGTARWDGIRNYQARNLLRDAVAPGDGILIYHSGCRIPGVAGTATVVTAGYPDPAQFLPDSPWFDGKSNLDNPRWYALDIRFQAKFARLLPARDLKQDPLLKDMVLFRQGRLSVQPVQESEWLRILGLAEKTKPGH